MNENKDCNLMTRYHSLLSYITVHDTDEVLLPTNFDQMDVFAKKEFDSSDEVTDLRVDDVIFSSLVATR